MVGATVAIAVAIQQAINYLAYNILERVNCKVCSFYFLDIKRV
jgi:hypothetical protein